VASTRAGKRTRGPNQGTPWARTPEDGISILRLALDTSDPLQRRRIEEMFSAGFSVYRAVQGDARDRARAFRAAHHERQRDPAAVRARLGLSRESLEHAAYAHVDAAPQLRRGITKALAMHLADSVWSATARHLFRDAAGKTQGLLRRGRWFDFTRLPGRARSHTTARKWETFRLHGSLADHRAVYVSEPQGEQVPLGHTGPERRFMQPRRMRPISAPDGWWSYDGPLAVVFSGLPGGTLVLPVRLPAAPTNQPILDHHLADPARWHKIDLVRRRDPHAAGGWRYEAHLMVLTVPYVSPSTVARRAAAARHSSARSAGIDVNVSNITVASHERGRDLRVTRIERDAQTKARGRKQARRERLRQRTLDRSRRAANRAQYQLSRRQDKRARRREAAGLAAVQVIPSGPRLARVDGKPLQAYRKDALSAGYRRGRAAQAADAASRVQARRDHARHVAGALVREHGCALIVEDTSIAAWARRWGRALAQLSPGTVVAALAREALAVAGIAGTSGGVVRASTATTALSQRCLCGARAKKPLAQRVHDCTACGLSGDRDAVAATLAACVALRERGTPASAYVDDELARALLYQVRTRVVLRDSIQIPVKGRQDVPSESTVHSSRDGWSAAEKGPTPSLFVVARRIVGMAPLATPDETGPRGQTTSERVRTRTNLFSYRVDDVARLPDSS
jgi:hypothetical protein